MFSVMPNPNSKIQQRRNSRPPEDLAAAMLNWKRQSGSAPKRQINPSKSFAEEVPLPLPPSSSGATSSTSDSPTSLPAQVSKVKTSGSTNTIPIKENLTHERAGSHSYLDVFLQESWTHQTSHVALVRDPRTNTSPSDSSISTNTTTSESSIENLDADTEAKEAAKRLWEEDATFVPKERMAEWLGQTTNSKALYYYLNNFQFSRMRLDGAFRKLCSKLYFKAEAQQIDRILEVFAQRYWACNPRCIFGSADIVYAVVYSLLLLNTDLHVAQGNYARMTRQAFVKNTMSTIHEQKISDNKQRRGVSDEKAWEADMEIWLKDMYVSVKHHQILQPLSAPGHTLEKRSSILGGRRVADMKRSVNGMIRKSTRESTLPEDIQLKTSVSAAVMRSSSPPPPPRSPRRDSFSSVASATSMGSFVTTRTLSQSRKLTPQPPMVQFMHTHGSALFASQPPYLKEGVLIRKHLLESATHKAKHREWREIFVTIGQGEIKMYALHNSGEVERRSMLRASSASFTSFADSITKQSATASFSSGQVGNKWASHSQLLGTIQFSHTLSNVLPPPGYNRQRPHVFAIQQPNGGVYLFQAASQEQVNEWVATANYWAARESKEPLPGGVSNMEYGWNSCLNDVFLDLDTIERVPTGSALSDPDAVTIYDWKPPAPPMVASPLNEKEQYDSLQKHLSTLNSDINEHRELKKKILIKFPAKSQNHAKVLSNWESKSKYMLHEIIKYQNYCDALEKSMDKRKEMYESERSHADNGIDNDTIQEIEE
ncbi:hypothetical protein J3Q64DRAFT_1652380 [Phycomyces blakesleeanus]|uniref:SEC7 domain-containing protein n=1 Tax=Phycomyces blakesleeanus TaxID=4837 RepID=A0ABR3BHF7_PHYBL